MRCKRKNFLKVWFFGYHVGMNIPRLLWIDFYRWTYQQCLETLQESLGHDMSKLVVTPNPEMLYEASRDNELLQVLENADLALPDWAGIFVGFQIVNSRLPKWMKYVMIPLYCARAVLHDNRISEKYGERITGSRLTQDLLIYASEKNISVTIIDPEVKWNSPGDKAKRASQEEIVPKLSKKYPGAKIALLITDTVPGNLPKHGIILATHGNGRQEKILAEMVKKYPDCWIAIWVGGSIDLLTGFRSPAPWFFRRFGGEWLYRLYKQPKKHYKRMKKVAAFLYSLK